MFLWKELQQKTFDTIIAAVGDIRYLGFFDRKKKTKLIVDASPEGLGAVLLQENDDGQNQVISFASKALTDLERNTFKQKEKHLLLYGELKSSVCICLVQNSSLLLIVEH